MDCIDFSKIHQTRHTRNTENIPTVNAIFYEHTVYFEAILTIKKFPRWHTYERKHVLRGSYSKYLETVFA